MVKDPEDESASTDTLINLDSDGRDEESVVGFVIRFVVSLHPILAFVRN